MNSAAAPPPTDDYIFRFDVPLAPVLVGGAVDLHGWLLQREGKTINGLRVLVQRRFRKRAIVRARRKRKRADVAAAFPDIAAASDSGFLYELRFGFGRSALTFQVLDDERRWRTFATATVFALPLTLLDRLSLPNLRRFLIFYLEHVLAPAVRAPSASPELCRIARREPAASATRRVELFATSKSNLFIVEIGELIAAGFREAGCDATLRLDSIPVDEPPPGTMQIVVTPHEFYNLFLLEQLRRPRARELTRHLYLLCTEQPETGWFQSNLQWGIHSLGVADINPLGVTAYRARGLDAQQLALGFHPILSHPRKIPHSQRTNDVTFLGSMTSRRELFFAENADFFARRRCHLRLVPLGFAKTKDTRSYLSPARRNDLLSQSRILLNVHYSEQKYFEWHRMLVGLANGCCIITETCQGFGALVPGRHFIMVEPEYLIPACEYFLAHPEECEAIANAGRDFIETELRQGQTCRAFLDQVEQEGTGALPVDSHAVPPHGAFRAALAKHTRRLLWRALREDMGNATREKSKADRFEVPAAATTNSEQQQRAAIVQKRAAYRARLSEQEAARARGESVFAIHDNAPFRNSSAPKLSVLITLYNYAQHIETCVASATAAAERLQEPVEIVIVNDASTDDSLARALRTQRTSRLPIRVLDKRFNTGLADARNTAVQIARAPYVFMMDADNLIFADGFRALLDAISADDYAAAFSMLCRFRGAPTNRVGLLSYYDWDPQILVQYPYIDAMAMFRRATLLELGGYDNELSQIGWFGWEDYAMWLRFAQHDLRVAFVPNTLCLYRHHDTSMINTTNLFELDLVRHFVERFGALVDRFEPRETVFGVERSKMTRL